jgi:hypothetical protein
MINKLRSLSLIPDTDPFNLYHTDLQSRNLLFATPTPFTVHLTGILELDNALMAPKFMATHTTFFLGKMRTLVKRKRKRKRKRKMGVLWLSL